MRETSTMKNYIQISSIYFLIHLMIFFPLISNCEDIKIPSPEIQQKIILKLSEEMIRLDGEGLLARQGRVEQFQETVNKIALKTLTNKTVIDFYNSFSQLNGTYTNLHSHVSFNSQIDSSIKLPFNSNQNIWIIAEADGTSKSKVLIDYIFDPETEKQVSEGDEIVAINKRPIKDWLDENFLFCKYPLKTQCDRQFEQNLLSYVLSWKGEPLYYHVKHLNNIVIVKINFKNSENNNSSFDKKKCDYNYAKRYPGMKLVHSGIFACIFEDENSPDIALLRISSFQYNHKRIPIEVSKEKNIYSLYDEVNALFPFWQKNSSRYKKLIIDVINNHGGNEPIPYYQILFQHPFQEQYVRFKKITELEDPALRAQIFWQTDEIELWFNKLLTSGIWSKLQFGDLTSPVPMFCVPNNLPCDNFKFTPWDHSFKGDVFVMLNEECISSCDGFVWAIHKYLNAKLYGFYQAADSAFSRLRINVIWDPKNQNEFKTQVSSFQAEFPENFLLGQIVANSVATDENGEVLAGRPLPLYKLVPYKQSQFYPTMVYKTIMNDLLNNSFINIGDSKR